MGGAVRPFGRIPGSGNIEFVMSWRQRALSFLGRPRRLAVVLGGGATLGAFEVGVLDVLARHDCRPDLLVGTSAGAVNAAFWAFDPEPWMGERLYRFWLRADNSYFFPKGPVPMVGRLVQGLDHLSTQDVLAAALKSALPEDARFEVAAIPLRLAATDARSGEKVVLKSGPVLPAVLASSAIPALFPPVEIGGRLLADGGMMANCDIETAVEEGATDVVVVDVMGDGVGTPPRGVWATAEDALGVMARRQTELAVRLYEGRARIARVRPRLNVRPRLLDFSLTRELFRQGRAAGERLLAEGLAGRRVVPGLYEAPPAAETNAARGTAAPADRAAARVPA